MLLDSLNGVTGLSEGLYVDRNMNRNQERVFGPTIRMFQCQRPFGHCDKTSEISYLPLRTPVLQFF